MRNILMLLLVSYGCGAMAAGEALHQTLRVGNVGTLHLDVIETGEPAYAPFAMSATVDCAATGLKKVLLTNEAVCNFDEAELLADKQSVLIHSVLPDLSRAQAHCTKGWGETVDIKSFCLEP